MPAASNSGHTGLNGLSGITADVNHDRAVVCVRQTLGPDRTAETTITEPQLRHALGVSHINLHNITGVELDTQSNSNGIVAMTMRSGCGQSIPVTNRQYTVSGTQACGAHHMATPGAVGSGVMPLKTLRTDKHGFVPVTVQTEQERERNKLNAAFYAGSSAEPSDADMYRHTIRSKNEGEERVAIPLRQMLTTEDGVMTAVASRCIVHQKKAPSTVGGAGAKVVNMRHKGTGEECDHLVVSSEAASRLCETVKSNTKVHPTFGRGLKILADGNVGGGTVEGDTITTRLTLHRQPTDETTKVTYQTDMMPAEIAASAVVAPDVQTKHDAEWHGKIWGKAKTPNATIVEVDSGGGADDGTSDEPL